MDANYFQRLFDYNYWAHHKVWECVMLLNEEQYSRANDYSIGSVQEQVVHTMGAEWLFLERVHGVSPKAIPGVEACPTREMLRAKWDTVEAGWRMFVDGLTDESMRQKLAYTSLNGQMRRETPLDEILAHIVNHGTDHRAQTLAAIHRVGGKTIEQDLIFYSWERAGQR